MLRDIKTAFKMMVNSVTWMDARTKSVILDKAKAVSDKIGFASWMTNPKKIIKYYHGVSY